MYLLELLSPVGLNSSVPMAAPLCTTEPRRSASSDMYPSWEARTIAVCPLTTAGAPSEDAKEPTMAQIPKPAAPTPVNSFNPLAIMACAPKWWGRLHDRLPTIAVRAATGNDHAFHLLPFFLFERK